MAKAKELPFYKMRWDSKTEILCKEIAPYVGAIKKRSIVHVEVVQVLQGDAQHLEIGHTMEAWRNTLTKLSKEEVQAIKKKLCASIF